MVRHGSLDGSALILSMQYAELNTQYAQFNTQYTIRNTQYAIRTARNAIRTAQYAIRRASEVPEDEAVMPSCVIASSASACRSETARRISSGLLPVKSKTFAPEPRRATWVSVSMTRRVKMRRRYTGSRFATETAVVAPAARAATLAATPVSDVQRSSAAPPGQPAIVPQQ